MTIHMYYLSGNKSAVCDIWLATDTINRFYPPHLCDCSKPGTGFLGLYVVVFLMFNDFRWEVVVSFAKIGGIVDITVQ